MATQTASGYIQGVNKLKHIVGLVDGDTVEYDNVVRDVAGNVQTGLTFEVQPDLTARVLGGDPQVPVVRMTDVRYFHASAWTDYEIIDIHVEQLRTTPAVQSETPVEYGTINGLSLTRKPDS